MQALQFGIKGEQKQQRAGKASKPSYKAINDELFGGRQVYDNGKGEKGYFALKSNTFVPITPTRYHVVEGELFLTRQVHLSPTGEKGFFDSKNEFRPATAAEMRRLSGTFMQPLHIVHTERKPTGHQPSIGKKKGQKQKRAA